MGVFSSEKFFGIPIPEDGVSTGTVSVANVSAALEVAGRIVSGSVAYPSITITLKGVPKSAVPFEALGLDDTFTDTFSYDGNTYHIVNVTPGPKFSIGGVPVYFTWSCTGVDLNNPRFVI